MPNQKGRFTQNARLTLSFAQKEAEQLQTNQIGTDHLLLGLLHGDTGIAYRVLSDLGISLERTKLLISQTVHRQHKSVGRLELSPGVKKVLELAVGEARQLGHHDISPEHLLLGLVKEPDYMLPNLLEHFGITPDMVRNHTMEWVLLEKHHPLHILERGNTSLAGLSLRRVFKFLFSGR